MNFPQAIASGVKKYFTFSGRASRSEHRYWILFVTLAQVVFRTLEAIIFHSPLTETGDALKVLEGLFILVTIIPTFADSPPA